jgi:hypothetical protein
MLGMSPITAQRAYSQKALTTSAVKTTETCTNTVQKVKNAMTSTSMLNDIVQAHEPYTSTEESTSATIDYTFFSHAGGQGHGQGLGLTSIHRYDEEQSDHQDEEDSENDAH